jgi:hypothetical protein
LGTLDLFFDKDTAHLLQDCPLHEDLRHCIWTEEIPVERKLHGSLQDLLRTAVFVREAGVYIRVNDERTKKKKCVTTITVFMLESGHKKCHDTMP